MEILKFFADRQNISYPMLADPDSKVIRAYGVFNHEATGMQKGFARPGYFFIGPDGTIKEKFFDPRYRERLTGNSILGKLFPELGQEVVDNVEAPHLKLALEQSDRTGVPGTRITVVVRVELPSDVHVYAPGTQGYKPIKLVLDATGDLLFGSVAYPASQTLYLPAIKEKVPVYEGTFRVSQEINLNTNAQFWGGIGKDGKVIPVTGKLDYQACDKTMCYTPTSVPVKWQIQVYPLDRTRAPMEYRHK